MLLTYLMFYACLSPVSTWCVRVRGYSIVNLPSLLKHRNISFAMSERIISCLYSYQPRILCEVLLSTLSAIKMVNFLLSLLPARSNLIPWATGITVLCLFNSNFDFMFLLWTNVGSCHKTNQSASSLLSVVYSYIIIKKSPRSYFQHTSDIQILVRNLNLPG